LSRRSTRFAHEAHVIPAIGSSRCVALIARPPA
jgi:hypothetical protein